MNVYCHVSCRNFCADVRTRRECAWWTKQGYCNDVNYAEFMEMHCKKSCNYC